MSSGLRDSARTSGRTIGKAVLLGLLTCALVLLIAMGSSRSTARVGGPAGPTSWPNLAGDLFVVVLAVCLICAALLAYVLWNGGRRRRREPELVRQIPRAPWLDQVVAGFVFLAVIGAVITAMIFAARSNGGVDIEQPPPSVPETTVPGAGGGPVSSGDAFVVHWWIVLGVAVIILGAALFLIIDRRRAPSVDSTARRPSHRERLRLAIEDSLDEIARDTDPRRAIIRAYAMMGQILAEHDLGRLPHEAPMEYLNRALTGIQLSRGSAERLTNLFVRARFSHHVVDAGLKEEAIAALAAVRDELEVASP